MSIESAVTRFRAKQAEQFSQTADIYRPVGEPTFTPEDGYAQPVVTVTAGVACKVTSNERQGQDVQAGETEVRLLDHTIKFPVDTPVEVNDIVEVTASTYNPLDTGITYRITDVDRREWQISRRCVIEEVIVPLLHGGSV